jgi:alpha-glucosidase
MSRKDTIRFFTELGGKKLVDDIKAYEKVVGRYNRQFAVKKRASAQWLTLGAVQQVFAYERGVRLRCQNGWLELHWVAADCLRVRMRTQDDKFFAPFSYAVHKVDWPSVPFEVVDDGQDSAQLEIRSDLLICRIDKRSSRLRLETLDNVVICGDKQGVQWRADGALRLSMGMRPDEACYGMGERAFGLQLRGKKLALWNTDPPPTYARGTDPLYFSIPFYLGAHNQATYGVFWDNSSRGVADLGASKSDELVFESESGELCYYLFAGSDVKHVLGRYTELTGRISLPPLWSLGYHQSRFSYTNQEAVLNIAKDFRSHGIPCDAIYLDIHYMSGFRSFTWDTERFPNIKGMIDTLHKHGFKVIPIVNPGVKVDPASNVYKSGLEWNVFLKYPDNKPAVGAVWPGMCHFPDFTDPAARSWWVQQMAPLIKLGADGIWNDMGEPSIFSQDGAITLPDYVVHNGDGRGGNHLDNHNVYGMLMGRATLEALQKHRTNIRPFNIVRSGYAGAQRYASTWTGDNTSDWDHLRLSLSMILNMSLSGVSMVGSDVGGFNGSANGELFTRWMQAASLMPFFRTHTSINTPPQEPWSFGQPYEVINRVTIELRYKLLPYLYSVVAQSKEYGWPIVRPLFMAEPDNPSIRAIDDAFMLGDALLVAPVLEAGAVRRSVYLPAGDWYDFWTNELFEGGQVVNVPAPLERLPLFVRAGAVIPVLPEMQYVGEQEVETLVYRVYPGDFETTQYEDKGEGLEYQEGDYRWIYITCSWDESKLLINRRIAGRFDPPYKALKLEVVGFDEEPLNVRVDRQGAPLWFYDDGLLELNIDTFQRIEIMRKSLPTDKTLVRRPW